jgi:NADH-quinone oxidoreductase subunit N
MFFSYNNLLNDFENYSISLLLFNIIIYIFMLTNIFLLLFLFDLKYIKTLNELKFIGNTSFLTVYLVLLFLSFAGTPPLLGFVGKFLIFIFILYKQNLFIFLIFLFLNFFSMYFYLQNLRFIVSKKISNKIIYKNNFIYYNSSVIFFFNIFNFFNITSIFYFEDFFIILNFINSNLNF